MFQKEYLCYSFEFLKIHDPDKKTISDNTDKIIMPESVLDYLSRDDELVGPYTFKLINILNNKSAYAGVLEFTSYDTHIIYVPEWLMQNIGVVDGGRVDVNQITLQKGKSIILRPHTENFFKISNPKRLLERYLRNFTTLYQGEIISIPYLGKIFDIDVIESEPCDAVNIIDSDITLEFINMFSE
jgi:hypothetical protein